LLSPVAAIDHTVTQLSITE